MAVKTPAQRRLRRRRRVRAKIRGSEACPRLAVYRSNRGLYAQLIDDDRGHTIAQASWNEADLRKLDAAERAKRAGELIAERAKKAGVTTVVFDRGGYAYKAQIKALADAAREGGLTF